MIGVTNSESTALNDTTTRSLDIRPADFVDADILARLLVHMDDGDAAGIGEADVATMRATLAEMALYPDFRAYLAFDNDVPVATFSLMIFRGPSHDGAKQALLDGVVVHRDRRGQGIGDTILAHALALATSAGCYKLMLSSNLKRIDAHRFYERAGFTQHGISLAIDLPPR